MKNLRHILLALSVLFAANLSAQVYISEYSASNLNQFLDNYNKYEDWIEIHNPSDMDVDISGWGISDKESKPLKWKFPTGTVVNANNYLVVWCSGRDEVSDGQYHTSFKLSQTKGNEFVVLSEPDETIVSVAAMQLTLLGHSRIYNEDGSWSISVDPSLGSDTDVLMTKASYTAEPQMSVEAGSYTSDQIIEITIDNSDETIRYTLNGHAPTVDSQEYTGPITVSETTVVKARAFSDNADVIPGKIGFATYFIDETFTVPFFSVAADRVQDLANGDKPLRPIGSIEYFSPEGKLITSSYGELNSHGQDSWVNPHRSLDWVSRDEMGYSRTVEAPLFSYSERDDYQRFMFRASGDDNYPAIDDGQHEFSCHIRDEYVHELAHAGGMKLDLRAVERAVLFLNGDYWGFYSIRERPVDHDYTAEYYDQDKYNIQYLTTWGDTEAEYGGNQAFYDWFDIRDFILDNDMSVDDNYQRAKDEIQLLGLIDYMITNLNVVSVDWLNYNTGWWRGIDPDGDHKKWGYMLWDNDATFDYYINYTGVPNESPDAEPCDIDAISDSMDSFFAPDGPGGGGTGGPFTVEADSCETVLNGTSPYPPTDSIFIQVVNQDTYCCTTDWDGICQGLYDNIVNSNDGSSGPDFNPNSNIGKHEKIFLKLQDESDEFRQLYYSRQADLMNTVFSCENMISKLDSMLATMTPEMPRQIERWGGTMEEWEANVVRLRTFIEARCELLDDGMVNCFDVTGPYPITFNTFPSGVGKIDLNTIKLKSFPWTGDYFGNMDNLIEAKSTDDDYEFVRWESTSGNTTFENMQSAETKAVVSTMDTLTAVFDLKSSVAAELPADVASFSVFPSPTSDVFTVAYSLLDQNVSQIELVNPQGQVIRTLNNNSNEVTEVINLTDLNIASGMYMVRLVTTNGVASKKLVYIK